MKTFIVFVTLLFSVAITSAQSKMYINKNSGVTDSVSISDIKSISFKLGGGASTNAQVLFSKGPKAGSQFNIYKMNSDGSNIILVKADAKISGDAIWNGDKTKIVYRSNSSTTGGQEIFLMNSDGTNAQQLTSDNAQYGNSGPIFRSSSKIWYENAQSTGWTEFTEINYDGSGKIKLTNFYSQGKSGSRISVNSANNKLLYYKQTSSWSPDGELFTSNIDFTSEVQLTNNAMWDGTPRFSPDGSKIAFSRETGTLSGVSNLFIMNVNGSGQTQVTNYTSTKLVIYPVWSPDGSKIIYSEYDGSQWDLFIINSDGTGKTNITNTTDQDEYISDWK